MKRGFTLIEIMVVIVILGILSAVAVPKLFGMVAKAKASEVPVAAGSYTKLQDAFLAEKTALGNWKNIGYVAPGNGNSNNFCYSQGSLTQDTVSIENVSEGIIGWGARNIATLNDCGVGSWWSLVITPNGSNAVNYAHNLSYAPCMALTANWNEGNTLTGNCESAVATTGKGEKPVEEKPVEDKPVVDETKEETNPSSQQNYEKCLQECSENRKHNGKNEHGIEQSCEAQCKNK